MHCGGVCLLSDVPGICAIVSSLCAASNRISDGMTGVCMMSVGATGMCVMSAGVTSMCVVSSVLPGVACDIGGDSWNYRMTSKVYTWYSCSSKNPVSPSRFPQKHWSERLELYNLLYTVDLVNLIVTICKVKGILKKKNFKKYYTDFSSGSRLSGNTVKTRCSVEHGTRALTALG